MTILTYISKCDNKSHYLALLITHFFNTPANSLNIYTIYNIECYFFSLFQI